MEFRIGQIISSEKNKFFITKINKNTIIARVVISHKESKQNVHMSFGDVVSIKKSDIINVPKK